MIFLNSEHIVYYHYYFLKYPIDVFQFRFSFQINNHITTVNFLYYLLLLLTTNFCF